MVTWIKMVMERTKTMNKMDTINTIKKVQTTNKWTEWISPNSSVIRASSMVLLITGQRGATFYWRTYKMKILYILKRKKFQLFSGLMQTLAPNRKCSKNSIKITWTSILKVWIVRLGTDWFSSSTRQVRNIEFIKSR